MVSPFLLFVCLWFQGCLLDFGQPMRSSSLAELSPSSLSGHSFSVVLCLWAGPPEILPFYISMSTDIAIVLVMFLHLLKQAATQQTSWHSGSCSLSTCSSTIFPETQKQGLCCGCIPCVWASLHNLSLHCVQLWLSLTVSIICRRKVFSTDEGKQ